MKQILFTRQKKTFNCCRYIRSKLHFTKEGAEHQKALARDPVRYIAFCGNAVFSFEFFGTMKLSPEKFEMFFLEISFVSN